MAQNRTLTNTCKYSKYNFDDEKKYYCFEKDEIEDVTAKKEINNCNKRN
jgi:hypothetical protein